MSQIVAEAHLLLLRRSLRELQRPGQRSLQSLPVDVRREFIFLLDQRYRPLVAVEPGAIVTHSQSGPDVDNSYTMTYGPWAGLASSRLLPQTTTKDLP